MINKRLVNHIIPISLLLSLCMYFTACNNISAKKESNDFLEKYRSDSSRKIRKEKGLQSLTKNIGEQFSIEDFINTSGKSVQLDFTKSDITIIDFWFNGCGPCIKEMSQFEQLLKGKEKQISIISISISSYLLWKKLFTEKSDTYAFLTNSISNWQHLNLKAIKEPYLKDEDSNDRIDEIISKLDVSFYPSFFVINKEGIIIARPMSAVEYIKNNIK